jgi:hypothetical protein
MGHVNRQWASALWPPGAPSVGARTVSVADRLFWIVDNGLSHRGVVAMHRLHQVDSASGRSLPGPRQLTEPGGNLCLDYPTEGAHSQWLPTEAVSPLIWYETCQPMPNATSVGDRIQLTARPTKIELINNNLQLPSFTARRRLHSRCYL